jgi:hypothetical protein
MRSQKLAWNAWLTFACIALRSGTVSKGEGESRAASGTYGLDIGYPALVEIKALRLTLTAGSVQLLRASNRPNVEPTNLLGPIEIRDCFEARARHAVIVIDDKDSSTICRSFNLLDRPGWPKSAAVSSATMRAGLVKRLGKKHRRTVQRDKS